MQETHGGPVRLAVWIKGQPCQVRLPRVVLSAMPGSWGYFFGLGGPPICAHPSTWPQVYPRIPREDLTSTFHPGAILFMGGMGRRGCIQAAALSAILFLADAADRRPSHAARGSRILQEDPGSSCRIPMGARAVPCILLRLRGGGAGGARGEGATARGGLGWPAAEVELSTKGIEGLLGADEDRPAASDSEGEQEESRETTTSLMSSNPCTEDEGDEDAKASQQDEGAIDRAGRPDGQHQTKADGAGMDLPPPPPRPWEDYIDKRRWTGGDIMAELER